MTLLLPLSPETALLFSPDSCWQREDFSPHLPKTSLRSTKGIWGLRAGRAHFVPCHLFNHWFLSNSVVHHASCILINVRMCDHDCALRKYVSLYLYWTPWRSEERELRSKLTSSSVYVCVYYKDGHWWSWDCIKIVNISTIKWSLHFVPLVKPPRFLQYRDSDWSLSLWLIPETSHKTGAVANILNDVYQVSIFECCF